jgi:rubrerythrin
MTDFDLDRYLRASRKVDLDGIDWDDIPNHPLTQAEARCLAYMMDIESHTVVYLRDLLATPAAEDPDVTSFLACWAYEELWHGEALSRFLGHAGHRLGPDRSLPRHDAAFPSRGCRQRAIRRAAGRGAVAIHVATMLASRLSADFVALHMTWGALNELTTLTGYRAVIERTEHPVLIDLLRRIIRDERRHFAFYRSQSRMRLAASPRGQRVTRWAMQRLWAPVGTGVRPQSETDFVIGCLFGDARGLDHVRDMDATIGELPGLEGARLVEQARGDALRRLPPGLVESLGGRLVSQAGEPPPEALVA